MLPLVPYQDYRNNVNVLPGGIPNVVTSVWQYILRAGLTERSSFEFVKAGQGSLHDVLSRLKDLTVWQYTMEHLFFHSCCAIRSSMDGLE